MQQAVLSRKLGKVLCIGLVIYRPVKHAKLHVVPSVDPFCLPISLTHSPCYLKMDEATENLILQLQLEDIEEERDRSKGKARKDDEIADADLALQVQEEEFKHTITIRSDYRMAQSIGRAVTDDAVNIAVLAGEERRAAADREMACRLSGQTARPDPQTSILDTDDDVLSRLSALNIDVATGEESQESSSSPGEAGESSAWATGRRPQRLNGPKNKCDTCMDMKHTVQMPCAHHYCRHCTVRLFTEALPDESLFPVRCCRQNIPMSLVSSYLGTDLTRQVEKKAVEYATTNRTYCHVASCATFIEPGYTHGSTGICPREHCGSQTCILCKKPAHDGDCPPRDDGSEEALQLAQSNGWQRCEQCQNVVELNHGCNHIT